MRPSFSPMKKTVPACKVSQQTHKRAQFEPLEHAMGFGQLVKRSRHQMGHDHQGDEKEGEVDLHVGFQMEAKDAADEDHGDLADDHRVPTCGHRWSKKKVSH